MVDVTVVVPLLTVIVVIEPGTVTAFVIVTVVILESACNCQRWKERSNGHDLSLTTLAQLHER